MVYLRGLGIAGLKLKERNKIMLSLAVFIKLQRKVKYANFGQRGSLNNLCKILLEPQPPQAQCEHGRQKYKDLYEYPDKTLKKIII